MQDNDLIRRLETFMREETGDDDIVVDDLTRMTGGYSLVMSRFTTRSPHGERSYVLRADPPRDAALTPTDRRHEWDLLSRLTEQGDVPMPAARFADLDGGRLGSPAIVLDYVAGPQLLGHLQTAGQDEQARLALDLAATIGTVHRVGTPPAMAALHGPATWDEYIDQFVAGWRAIEAGYAERNPFLRWVAAWLDTHRPRPAPLTLVHGEFQTANVMIDATGALQVIDWEYAHIGDPRVDLGWIQNVAAFSPPDPIAIDPIGFCARYCEVTGLSEDVVNPLTVGWFSILAGYKALGGLLHGMSAMAAGHNHLITSAYLVSALPFSHRLWREGTAGLEAAMAAIESQMEAVS